MQDFIITQQELKQIAHNLTLTEHAKQRAKERLGTDDMQTIQNYITHSPYAWNNTDGTKCIAINNSKYFVIDENQKHKNKYILITIKEESKNNVTVSNKMIMAFFGKKPKRSLTNNKTIRKQKEG